MRVLSTITGSQGHARAVLPVVRGLVDAGHEVLVVLPSHLAVVFEGSGARVEPAMPNLVDAIVAEVRKVLANAGETQYGPEIFDDPRVKMMLFAAGPHVTGAYRAVLPLAEEFKPDLVFRDGGELSGVLIAEKFGIPHVSAPSGTGNVVDPDGAGWLLNERRKEVGLPERTGKWSIYAHGKIDCVPNEYSFAAFDVPPAITYRQPMLGAMKHSLPPELAGLSGDKPIVLASVGTSLPVLLEMQERGIGLPDGMIDPVETLYRIVQALSTIDCHAVVSTGGVKVEGIEIGPNVHIMDFVPQPLLLEVTQLFLTHGGYNGIREGIRAGVPMAALPQFGDEHHNAERLTKLGLGEWITDVSPEGIAKVCDSVLNNETIRQNIRTAQRKMLGLPGIESVVGYLESLVDKTAKARS
ncbi:glycosyltransferase [Amycolatopsis sp. TRM77291]